MKKVYNKPIVLIEDFAVAEAFAAYSCGVRADSGDVASCSILNVEMETANNRYGLFSENVVCSLMPDMEDFGDSICFHGAILIS